MTQILKVCLYLLDLRVIHFLKLSKQTFAGELRALSWSLDSLFIKFKKIIAWSGSYE